MSLRRAACLWCAICPLISVSYTHLRPPLRRSAPIEAESDGVIEGRNAVIEALRAGVTIDKIFIAKGETDATLGHIASTAREKGIVVVDADRRKLDGMSRTHSHQGVIALCAVREYVTVDAVSYTHLDVYKRQAQGRRDCGNPRGGRGDHRGSPRRGDRGRCV